MIIILTVLLVIIVFILLILNYIKFKNENFIECNNGNFNNSIVSCSTQDYSNSLSLLISSIHYTNKNVKIVIFCINWNIDLIKKFKEMFPYVNFIHIYRKINNKNDILKMKVEFQYKFFKNNKNLNWIWIDADSVVLKDITPIFNSLKNNHLCVRLRLSEKQIQLKFAVGVIGFSNYDRNIVLKFLTHYYNKCKNEKGYNNWYSDQISLYETYKYFNNKIKYFNLSEKYHSINGTLNTIVYSRRNDKLNLMNVLDKSNIKYKLLQLNTINYKHYY